MPRSGAGLSWPTVELIGRVSPSSPLIVVALHSEAAHFAVEHPVLVTGVGKLRAGLAVTRVLAEGPRPASVVNVGTAGGLRPGITGTHEVTTVIQHDFDDEGVAALTGRHDGPPIRLGDGAAGLDGAAGFDARGVVLATGDRFVSGGSERERVAASADLVDMEGYAVAAAAGQFDVPVRLVKHVSDSADSGAETTWTESVDACARLLAEWVHEHV